jgi:tRNA threonylcarbamoyladenosine biosynthesis protein TsaB
MSRILLLEASGLTGGVAMIESRRLVWSREFVLRERRDGGPLASWTAEAMASVGFPDLVVAGVGPGSYNGIRSAVAFARGVALARGVPVFGLSSLHAWRPGQGGDRPLILWGDARGGQVMYAILQNAGGQILQGPVLIGQEKLNALAAEAGLPMVRISGQRPREAEFDLALLADAAANPERYLVPEPIYLKPPHITSPKRDPRLLGGRS